MHLILRRWALLPVLAVVAAILLSPSLPAAAAPVACSTFLQPYVTWAQSAPTPAGLPVVLFQLTSLSKDGPASYAADGSLRYLSASGTTPAVLSTRVGLFTRDAQQYFSDRTYAGTGQPFDAQHTDKLGLSINAQTGAVTLRLASWGDAPVAITPVCENGLMYGFGNTPNLQHLYVIRLEQATSRLPT